MRQESDTCGATPPAVRTSGPRPPLREPDSRLAATTGHEAGSGCQQADPLSFREGVGNRNSLLGLVLSPSLTLVQPGRVDGRPRLESRVPAPALAVRARLTRAGACLCPSEHSPHPTRSSAARRAPGRNRPSGHAELCPGSRSWTVTTPPLEYRKPPHQIRRAPTQAARTNSRVSSVASGSHEYFFGCEA
jgi:hypothetical protein